MFLALVPPTSSRQGYVLIRIPEACTDAADLYALLCLNSAERMKGIFVVKLRSEFRIDAQSESEDGWLDMLR